MRILSQIVRTGWRRFNISHHPSCVCIVTRYKSQNYYEVLDISPTATDKEVRDAYIKMSKELHPDTSEGDEESFNKITEAYNILSKALKREEYDRRHFLSREYSDAFVPQTRETFYQEQKRKHSPFKLKNFIEYTVTCAVIFVLTYCSLHLVFYFHPHVSQVQNYDPKEGRRRKARLEQEYRELQRENKLIKEREEIEMKQQAEAQTKIS